MKRIRRPSLSYGGLNGGQEGHKTQRFTPFHGAQRLGAAEPQPKRGLNLAQRRGGAEGGCPRAAERRDARLDLAVAVVKIDARRRSGWSNHATTLHRLGRAAEARDVLLSALDKLGDDSAFLYELAHLFCLLHRVEEARAWLGKAFDALSDANTRQSLKLPAGTPLPAHEPGIPPFTGRMII